MKSRRKAREAAVQALYQNDTLGDWSENALSLFFACFLSSETPVSDVSPKLEKDEIQNITEFQVKSSESENRQFSLALIRGVSRNLEVIDREISGASLHWSMARMARVDRNILRLATFELLYLPEVPVNVTINEAVELAKLFGSDDSRLFVNGVLDNIAKALEARGIKKTGHDIQHKPKVAAA